MFVIVRHRSSPSSSFVIVCHRSSSFTIWTSSVRHLYVICLSSLKTTFSGFIDIIRHNMIWTSFYDTSMVSGRRHLINKGKFALSLTLCRFRQIHVYLTLFLAFLAYSPLHEHVLMHNTANQCMSSHIYPKFRCFGRS